MELSERIRIRAEGNTDFKPYYDVLGQWADEIEQLEADYSRLLNSQGYWYKYSGKLEADVTKLENEVIRLEDKNDALMKLAGMYIKSYEDLAFGDAAMESAYCDFCDDVIKPEEMDERHSNELNDYHAECCPGCTTATEDARSSE